VLQKDDPEMPANIGFAIGREARPDILSSLVRASSCSVVAEETLRGTCLQRNVSKRGMNCAVRTKKL
jgi:hypothetical protein